MKEAGLDYYNHNLDTSPEFYGQVITTHTQADRFDTLAQVRSAGIKVPDVATLVDKLRNEAKVI